MDSDKAEAKVTEPKVIRRFSINKYYILAILLSLLVISSAFYKYSEWSLLNNFTALYNSTWHEELSLNESSSNLTNDLLNYLNEISASTSAKNVKQLTDDELSSRYKKVMAKLRLTINDTENYIDTLNHNKTKFNKPHFLLTVPLSNRTTFIKSLIRYQNEYYDGEIVNARKGLAILYIYLHDYTLADDFIILQGYDKEGQKNLKNYANNFGNIGTLKKYTANDFKFSHEQEIKAYYPQAMVYLNKYRSYFSTYYAIAEDYVKEDYDSAAYKYARLQQDIINLNEPLGDVFKQYEERDNDDTKSKITYEIKQLELIKEYKNNRLNKYPLLKDVINFDDDLVLCQLYNNKIVSLYKYFLEEYPTASSISELLIQLRKVSPRTDKLDTLFNKKLMSYAQDSKKITVTCKSGIDDKKYSFITLKNDE